MKRYLLSAATLFLAGCHSGALVEYLNNLWPPVDAAAQRQKAIDSGVDAMTKMGAPDIAVQIDLSAAGRYLKSDKNLAKAGVTDLSLSGDRQLLHVLVAFDKTFGKEDGIPPALQELKPRVVGTLEFMSGITSAANQANSSTIDLTLLPVFNSLKVKEVRLAEKADASVLGEAIAGVLNTYANNVLGALSATSLASVKINAASGATLDPGQTLKINGSGVQGTVQTSGDPVRFKATLDGIVSLIDGDELSVILHLAPLSPPQASAPAVTSADASPATVSTTTNDFDSFRTYFREVERSLTAAQSLGGAVGRIAVRKAMLSRVVNEAMTGTKVCADADIQLPKTPFANTIAFPDENSVDCTSTRDCAQNRECSCTEHHDTRNCSACLLHNPFGGCILRGNDPFCEAAKATQNGIYAAQCALEKGDCERLKTQKKATCEFEKAGEKAICETGKEALKRLARTGKFANLKGSYGAVGKATVCIQGISVNEDISTLSAAVSASGEASVDLSLKFTPLNIVGHMACQAPWTEDQKFTAAVHETAIPLVAHLTPLSVRDTLKYDLDINKSEFELKLDPGPTKFFLTSPNMTIACQGFDLLKPLVIVATPFIPELKGSITVNIDATHTTLDASMPALSIAGQALQPTLRDTGVAVVAEVNEKQ